jgi:uncharacterized SAM-binding protein YcdF (DUF218 family)
MTIDRAMSRLNRRYVVPAIALGVGLVLGLQLGFLVFASFATRKISVDARSRADAIVVLTGGAERIGVAARLLAAGHGRRLLVSGVHRSIGRTDIERLTGLPADLVGCCVDVDYFALDTIGNAQGTSEWVRQHGFGSLIVVTSSYHMPRSLTEFRLALPGVALVPYPVLPAQLREEPWWLSPVATKVLVAEYVKLLPAVARWALLSAIPGSGAGAYLPAATAAATAPPGR